MDRLRTLCCVGLFCLIFQSLLAAAPLDEELPTDTIGYLEEGEEVADRDRDIPSFYERNRMSLMQKRDRQLRREGKCCPPPDVIVSPQIYTPRPVQQVQVPQAESR
ncbi:MAG: hypothetical protein VX777_02655 [Chlamydiota bacterium]|nr:hypothetical protein [Chlamydiota bacterium]